MEEATMQVSRAASDVQAPEVMKSSTLCPHTSTMIAGYIVLAASLSIIIGTANLPGTPVSAQFVMLTLAGAVAASSSAFLLNPTKEPPRIVCGRALVAMVAGVVGPRVGARYIDWVKNLLMTDQILMFGGGFAIGLVGFMLAVPFVRTGFVRSQDVVEDQFDKWVMPPKEPLPDDITHANGKPPRRKR